MEDVVDNALQTRCIPHSRFAKGKSGHGARHGPKSFNPLSTLGRYTVQLGSGGGSATEEFWLEIHELTDKENGLAGSFNFGKLSGIFLLAGSRKVLQQIVESEQEKHSDGEDEISSRSSDGDDDDDDETIEDSSSDERALSALELEDAKINRRARAFEKNSFRNPKFWMTWKGRIAIEEEEQQVSCDMGYLVFAGNKCDRFEGTITCPQLDWSNLKIRGRKVHSRSTPCALRWTDFT